MQTHISGNESNSLSSGASQKIPLAFIMDACPMAGNGLSAMLERRLLKKGQIIVLDKAAYLAPLLLSHTPDIVVMDISGRDESALQGLQCLVDYHKKWPQVPFVICTAFTDIRLLQQIKNIGVSGICHKYDPLNTLENSMGFAMAGSGRDSPTIERILNATNSPQRSLTRKEIQVILCLLEGSSVSDVAAMMHRDIRTVSTHKRSAMKKLGYRSDAEMFSKGQWMSVHSGE